MHSRQAAEGSIPVPRLFDANDSEEVG